MREDPLRWALFLPAEVQLAWATSPAGPALSPGSVCATGHSGRGAGLPARAPYTRPAPALDETFWQLLKK